MNILLLSVSIGAGHIKAAEAIKEEVEQRYKNANIILVDALKYVNPLIDKLVVKGYLKTLKSTPMLYKKMYEMADSKDNVNELSKLINKFMARKLKKLIKENTPDVIVSTHPFPLQTISNLKVKKGLDIPLVAVLTDYITHSFWKQEGVNAYVVAHEYMKHSLIQKGVSEDKIFDIGIPVGKSFLENKNREDILREFKLKDIKTFLIMGGSLGMGSIDDIFLPLLKIKEEIQIIVLAGKNEELIKKLNVLSEGAKNRVEILGYTDKVADLMSISDVLVTKPGGLTISEALVKELPMIVISPIPGQEERNAQFLINSGLATSIINKNDVDCVMFQIMHNPLKLKQMKEMAKFYAKPNAAKDIVGVLEKVKMV